MAKPPPPATTTTKQKGAHQRVADAPLPRKPRVSPAQFVRNIRSEIGKVTWPTRKETVSTTIAVFVMVFFASLFFLLVDQIFYRGISWLLGAAL